MKGKGGPVLLHRPARPPQVLEVRLAQVLVLLHIEPEVEGVLDSFALQEDLSGSARASLWSGVGVAQVGEGQRWSTHVEAK